MAIGLVAVLLVGVIVSLASPDVRDSFGHTKIAGTGQAAAGFVGRSKSIAGRWALSFQDDFVELAKPGTFLSTYSDWSAYPANYSTTAGQQDGVNRGDHYDIDNISVTDVGNTRLLNCHMRPRSKTSDKKNWGCAPAPQFDVGFGKGRAKSMKLEMRVRIPNPSPGWNVANLLWFDDKPWPTGGEIDFWEQSVTDTVGAFFHYDNGQNGGDRLQFATTVLPTSWHIIGFEFISGKSYKQFLDGVQIGSTVKTRVPATPGRLVLQNEPVGEPLAGVDVQYDWVTVWTSA